MKPFLLVVALFAASLVSFAEQAPKPLLLQSPSLSKTSIVFAYAGNLWIVAREGGEAKLLVGGTGLLSSPLFSPDGTQVAFTGDYDGNADVFVVPASGGQPRQLTRHPGADVAVSWSPDGKAVLFRSTRTSYSRFEKLFSVPVDGGMPTELPLPMGVQASYSPDASHVAYVPFWNRRLGAEEAYMPIKQYRGGKTARIWIANLADSSVEKIPQANSNDSNPLWVGDAIYFISNRAGTATLFSYDLKSKAVKKLVENDGFDIKTASAGPGALVYEQLGSLRLYDLSSGRSTPVPVTISAELPQTRNHFEPVAPPQFVSATLSPSGVRAVLEARGELFSVPVEKGDARNLTKAPDSAERSPAWSPDGKWIAYFSDEAGEYALYLKDPSGLVPARKLSLGDHPTFFYDPVWSPDSRRIAYRDKQLALWFIDVETGARSKVDVDLFDTPLHEFDAAWSPDSRWLTYTKQLENFLHGVFVYDTETKVSTQVSDGMSDTLYPQFDASGKYLFFTASTNTGLATAWLDMTSQERPVTRSVYVAVLKKDEVSPLAPESDEEKPEDAKAADKKDDKKDEKAAASSTDKQPAPDKAVAKDESKDKKSEDDKKTVKVAIDFDGLSQRILALPVPARNYVGLSVGKEGIVYLLEAPTLMTEDMEEMNATVQRFDLKTRKTEQLLEAVSYFTLSAKKDRMLYCSNRKWFVAAADKAPKGGEGALKTEGLQVWTEPRNEWRQIFEEVLRLERDFFYDPNYHGLDLAKARRVYEPFLAGVGSRGDLNYLLADLLGYLNVQHLYLAGGQRPETKSSRVGLLGADYAVENGRYRFAKVYDGENWNPKAKAPLTQPGVNVKPGDYLLAVNGREVLASEELFGYFLGAAGKQTVLKVGANPDGKDAREVTVVPIDNEGTLRNLAWIEGNRRKVDQLSGGRLAYVYIPNTAGAGYTSFNRYYFAQIGKQGAILDERFNGGGQLADYVIDYLRRPLLSYNVSRDGRTTSAPQQAIHGPKVMIVNEYAGSGGDAMPWYFRKTGVGKLVGTRTWGGLVGIGGYPALVDGGFVTAPRWGLHGTGGEWEIENYGIDPDIEVEMDPKLVRQGRDPQLEKAVEVALDELAKNPPAPYKKPAFPNYHPKLPEPVTK